MLFAARHNGLLCILVPLTHCVSKPITRLYKQNLFVELICILSLSSELIFLLEIFYCIYFVTSLPLYACNDGQVMVFCGTAGKVG